MDSNKIKRGIIISSVTFISVYLLCTRFVGKTYALISCSIFAFEPKLILNSFLGTPESAYIFMISIMLWLFFSNKLRNIYISFCILGLISLIRYEGLLLIIPLSVMYFIKMRDKKDIYSGYITLIFENKPINLKQWIINDNRDNIVEKPAEEKKNLSEENSTKQVEEIKDKT